MSSGWDSHCSEVMKHVVKIETYNGHGTGFHYATTKRLTAIITAHHVVWEANYWDHPIIISRPESEAESEKFRFDGQKEEISIYASEDQDCALILINHINGRSFSFPLDRLHFLKEIDEIENIRVGSQVGWIGFPQIHQPDQPCFFTGSISALGEKSYIIHGVALPGVSGGPVFLEGEVEVDGGSTSQLSVIGSITSRNPVPGSSQEGVLQGLSSAENLLFVDEIIERESKKTILINANMRQIVPRRFDSKILEC